MKKVTSILAILLVLAAVNCFGACVVSQSTLPPCHQHQQHHVGQLVWTHLDFTLPTIVLPVFPLDLKQRVVDIAAPPVSTPVRPPLISLRI